MECRIVPNDLVGNRRGPFRRGPSFATTKEYRRYVEGQARFLVVRAGDAIPAMGRKSPGERRIRSALRVPFRADLNVFDEILERAAATSDPQRYHEASDAIWDAVAELIRLTSRMINDGKIAVGHAQIDNRRVA